MVNNTVLVGRIANGLELKQAGNAVVADINIAVQSKKKDADGNYKTNFFRCELWNKKAEKTVDYFKIGDMVSVVGSIDIDVYEKDGVRREIYKIIPDSFNLVTPSKERNLSKDQSEEQIYNDIELEME